jgi:exosortase/archaeosortase family protein
MSWIKNYFNFTYFFKLVGLTLLLNYFAIGFNALVSPEGSIYNAFLDQNWNFIQLIRYVIMEVSNMIAHLFKTNSYISGPQMMKIGSAIEVEIWFPCLGLGVISFWIAFIVTNTGGWQSKLLWCIGGSLGITIINCWRIGLLLISLDKHWQQQTSMDHHDMFNIAAYVLVGLLMYSYSEGKAHSLKGENNI